MSVVNSIHPGAYSLMTYNVWGLPVWVPRSDQKRRFSILGQVLSQREESVLCLQETFSKKLRRQLLPALAAKFPHFGDYTISKRIAGLVPIDVKGGLMTLSKYPILEEQFFPYPLREKMRWEERLAKKGFIWSKIKTPFGIVQVINTHLYASGNLPSEKQRLLQIQCMKKILDSISGFYDHPVLLMGDINICHPFIHQKYPHRPKSLVYDYLLTEMGMVDSMPEITEANCTIHAHRNRYVPPNNDLQKLDYCFIRLPENHQHKWLHQEPVFHGEAAMSDHLALAAKLKWWAIEEEKETMDDLVLEKERRDV